MKMYNKPVVEINSFDVEDIITASTDLGVQDKNDVTNTVYSNLTGGSTDSNYVVYEW